MCDINEYIDWNTMLTDVKTFLYEFNCLPSSTSKNKEEKKLGIWLLIQKKKHLNGEMNDNIKNSWIDFIFKDYKEYFPCYPEVYKQLYIEIITCCKGTIFIKYIFPRKIMTKKIKKLLKKYTKTHSDIDSNTLINNFLTKIYNDENSFYKEFDEVYSDKRVRIIYEKDKGLGDYFLCRVVC